MNLNDLHGGRFEWYGTEVIDDDGTTIPVVHDVTMALRKHLAMEATYKERAESLAKELQDIRNRRGWEEVTCVTDDRTGRVVVVRTFYRWQAEAMRVEATPER